MLQGPGAGGAETATAVIGDLLSVLGPRPAGEVATAFRELPLEPPEPRAQPALRAPRGQRPARRAGSDRRALRRSRHLARRHDPAARTPASRPRSSSSRTRASEENARAAVDEIATLDFCHGQPRVLRVLAA